VDTHDFEASAGAPPANRPAPPAIRPAQPLKSSPNLPPPSTIQDTKTAKPEQQGREAELPEAPTGVTAEVRTTALELRDTPEVVGRRLIESWLPPFYMVGAKKLDRFGLALDLFGLVIPGSDPADG